MDVDLRFRERNLPGIGRLYELPLDGNRLLVVVVHRVGRREIVIAEVDSDKPSPSVTLDHDQAIAVASLLTGARFTIEPEPEGHAPVWGSWWRP